MGRIELILGCMFSGKSSELIRRIRRYQSIHKKVLCINYINDTRYGENNIITHDQTKEKAIFISKLDVLLQNPDFNEADIIAINEGQFFPDLYDMVTLIADNYNKTVIICGLDGDFNRQPFGDILKLIPHAEDLCKLSALCGVCNDGTNAAFTKRITKSTETVLIGGSESYIPVCRKCYNETIQTKCKKVCEL